MRETIRTILERRKELYCLMHPEVQLAYQTHSGSAVGSRYNPQDVRKRFERVSQPQDVVYTYWRCV